LASTNDRVAKTKYKHKKFIPTVSLFRPNFCWEENRRSRYSSPQPSLIEFHFVRCIFVVEMNAWEYLWRATQLAERGRGRVEPNPCVGAVLADEKGIVGEGFHARYGGAHAEVAAFDDVRETERIARATLFVTLEPCNHYGKTPPCVNRILDQNVKSVVVGRLDPHPLMAGKSIEILKKRGVNVRIFDDKDDPALARRLDELLRTFRVNLSAQRPYVTLKWAQSADGYIGMRGKRWILTGPESQRLTHRLRAAMGAVWIGGRTAVEDDPLLNVRKAPGGPVRRIVVAERPLPPNLRLFSSPPDPVWIVSRHPHPAERLIAYESDWEILLKRLYTEHALGAVLVEGGATTHARFLSAELWDKIYVYQSLLRATDGECVAAPALPGNAVLTEEFALGPDVVRVYERNRGVRTYPKADERIVAGQETNESS
jgi:diaminohydroxyphosphoribosylaminopyrimidine deaminase/5-amino-6-(5-phosphoribosylamino)uracil reductase